MDQAKLDRMRELEQKYGIDPMTASAPQPQQTVPTQQAPTSPADIPKFPTVTEIIGKYLKEQIPYVSDVGELGGALVGMKRGATAGRVLGLPGMVGGGIIGATIGRGAGEVTEDIFLSEETDPVETLYDMYQAGGLAVLGEGIGTIFPMAYRGIKNLRRGKQLPPEEARAVQELQNALKAREAEIKAANPNSNINLTLTPAQISQSGLQQNLEKIAISGFGGEKPLRDLYEAQADFIVTELERLVPNLGTATRQEAGAALQGALRNAEAELITWAKPKYAELDRLAVDAPVSIQSTQQKLRRKLAISGAGRKTGTRLDPEVEELYRFVLQEKQNNTFKSQFQLLSRLSSDLRKLKGRSTNPNDTYEKALVETIESVHDDLGKAAEKTGNTALLDKYNEVSTTYRNSMSTLRDSAISGLASKNPEFVGETIYRDGNVTSIQKAFEAIDEARELAIKAGKTGDDIPNTEAIKNQIRAGYLDELITPVQVNENTIPTAQKLLDNLTKNPKKRDTYTALFNATQRAAIEKTLKWGATMETFSAGNFSLIVRGRQSGSLNKIATQLAQSGAFTGTAIGSGIALSPVGATTAIGFLVAPAWLAKRAVNGQVSSKLLGEMTSLAKKFNENKFTSREWVTLFTLLADNTAETEKLPPSLQIPGLNAKDALRMHALELKHGLDPSGNAEEYTPDITVQYPTQ